MPGCAGRRREEGMLTVQGFAGDCLGGNLCWMDEPARKAEAEGREEGTGEAGFLHFLCRRHRGRNSPRVHMCERAGAAPGLAPVAGLSGRERSGSSREVWPSGARGSLPPPPPPRPAASSSRAVPPPAREGCGLRERRSGTTVGRRRREAAPSIPGAGAARSRRGAGRSPRCGKDSPRGSQPSAEALREPLGARCPPGGAVSGWGTPPPPRLSLLPSAASLPLSLPACLGWWKESGRPGGAALGAGGGSGARSPRRR